MKIDKEKLLDHINECANALHDSGGIVGAGILVILRDEVELGRFDTTNVPRSIDDWHEDIGDVLWWKLPIEEPPYCGTPLDSDWPDYHTHWTPIDAPKLPD